MRALNKFFAVLTAAVMLACMLPLAAMATEAAPLPAPTATATASPQPITLWANGYTVTGDGKALDKNKIKVNASGLEFTIPFTLGAAPEADLHMAVTVDDQKGNFSPTAATGAVTATVLAGKTQGEFVIPGLKYFGNGNALKLKVTPENGTPIDLTLTVAECDYTEPTPTPAPTPTPTATPEPTPEPTPDKTEEPVATPTPEPVYRAPGLIVKSSSIGASSINAGEAFKLSLTVYATSSGNESLNDVLVSIAPAEGVTLASGSTTQFIGTMAVGSTKTIQFPMLAGSSFTGGVSSVNVTLSATGAATGTQAGSTTTIAVPINQPDRFEISRVECPETLMVGEEETATVTFVNKGKNPVANLTLSLSGTNLSNASQSQYVGNLAAGTEDSVDFDIMGVEAGSMAGTITISYEGSDGQTVTATQEISCMMEEAFYNDDMGMDGMDGMDGYDDAMGQDVNTGLPMAAKVLIIAGGVAAAAVAVVLIKKRRAKKKAAMEAEDEDI